MEKYELENKIKALEQRLENHQKNEELMKASFKKTREMVYEVARQNAEKIIFKAVTFTHDFKTSINETLLLIEEKPNNFKMLVEKFLQKNSYFISQDIDTIKEYISKIVDRIYKDSI